MSAGYISDITNLREWFDRVKTPLWNLYHGFLSGNLNQSNLLYKNEEVTDMDESFALLQQLIQMNSTGGGKFTIYLPNKAANMGVRAFFSPFANPIQAKSNVAGFGGINSDGSMPFLGGLNVQQYVKQEIEKEKRIWDLERKVEDKENPIFGLLKEPALAGLWQSLAMRLMGGAAPAQVAMSGFDQVQQGQSPRTETDTDQDEYSRKVLQHLNRIAKVFPDLATFLDALADFIEEQPGMAIGLFNERMKKKTQQPGRPDDQAQFTEE